MDLKPIITKILNSEPLNALEKAELETLDLAVLSPENLAALQQERDALQQELSSLRHRSRMEKLCAKFHCTDPGYLEFCARRNNIDTGDDDAMTAFAAELAKVSPGCFQAQIVPGSNAGNSPATMPDAGGSVASVSDRISIIAESISEAPAAH